MDKEIRNTNVVNINQFWFSFMNIEHKTHTGSIGAG